MQLWKHKNKQYNINNIRDTLRACTVAHSAALTTGNKEEYNAAPYCVRRAVKEAKKQYREKRFEKSDSRALWQSLYTTTDHKSKPTPIPNVNTSLADKLNMFYARFENTKTAATLHSTSNSGEVTSEHEVRRGLKQMNLMKTTGPDGITGRVLRTCADQLAPVFFFI